VPLTRIPEPYRLAFSKINKLSMSEVESISTALSKSPLAGGLQGAILTVSEQVPTLSGNDTQDIVRAVYSLYVYRSEDEAPLPKFVAEILIAMRSSGKELSSLTTEDMASFQNKITRLLDVSTLVVASKAERLRTDFAFTFHGIKIVTDIRPIFAKTEDRPVGAAIIHNMKIEYHDSGEHKYFYVALDPADLDELKKSIHRAEAKASSLSSLLKASSLSDLSQVRSK
jgi:hypothetical protein